MTHPIQISVASRIVQFLGGCGVDVMFSQSLPSKLVLAAEDAGIRQVTYRTENAGGSMADAYARMSGKIGVVCAQNGPAATLLVPPLAEAMKASVPVLALVQDVPRDQTDKNAFQEFDHIGLFATCTKWARVVNDAARVDDHVRQALIAATTGRPGPVALMLPADLLLESRDFGPLQGIQGLGMHPLDRVVASPERIAEAAKIIGQAEAPIVIAGGGVHGADAAAALAQLQDVASLPVGTTMMGKGAVDETHPLSLGLLGNAMGKGSIGHHVKELIEATDVVLLIGTRTNQNGTDSWSLVPDSATVIHLDVDGQEVGRNYPALRLVGDAKLTLEKLTAVLAESDLGHRLEARSRVEAAIAAARTATIEDARKTLGKQGDLINPEEVMSALAGELTPETTIVADASYSSVWINTYLTALKPGMRFVTPRGLAGLGWGYPMALGAQLARPDQTIVCVSGDGGFGHVWSELETAVREELPVTLILLNNGVLGYQKDAEDVKFGRHTTACTFHPVNHTAIADACGCSAKRVDKSADLGEALRAALSARRPFLLEVMTDPQAYPPLTMFDDALEQARGVQTKYAEMAPAE